MDVFSQDPMVAVGLALVIFLKIEFSSELLLNKQIEIELT